MIKTLISPEEISTLARPCYADEEKALAYIVEAEQNNIKPAIGDDLFIQLKEGGQTFLLEGGIYERNGKRYELNGIKKALAYFVISRLYESSTIELTRQGAVNRRSEFSDNADERDIISASRETYAIANRYMEEIEKYLGTDVKNTSQRVRFALVGGGSNTHRQCGPSSSSGGASPSANINVVQGLGNSDKDVISQAGVTREFNAVRAEAEENLTEAKAYTDDEITKAVISGGGGVIVDGSVTTDKIAYGAVTSDKLSEEVQGTLGDILPLKNQLAELLWSTATFTMSGSKIVHANTNPNATIKATFTSSSLIADEITITLPNGNIESVNKTNTLTYQDTTPRSYGNYTFTGKVVLGENNSIKTAIIYVRNKVYVGMATSYQDIMNDSYKMNPTTSVADGTYNGTSPADNSKFFLVVPNDVAQPNENEFTMGGAPASISRSTEVIGGITYTIFETNGSYNKDTNLNLKW